jgi:hypothetical protein
MASFQELIEDRCAARDIRATIDRCILIGIVEFEPYFAPVSGNANLPVTHSSIPR